MNEELILSMWKKAGYGFAVKKYSGTINLEQLICDSTQFVRGNSRLFSGILSWLIHHGALINVHKLIPMLNDDNEAIVGLLMDLAASNGADRKLLNVVRNCRKNAKEEFLFNVVKKFKFKMKEEKEKSDPIYKKWGFYNSENLVSDKNVYGRKTVLKENLNLAMRAFLGPNSRSEILFCMLSNQKIHIKELCREIRISYQPVYKEVENMVENGLLASEKIGNMRFISMSAGTKKFLKSLPVT